MRFVRQIVAACLLLLVLCSAAGCGATTARNRASGQALTIYSSLPFEGPSRARAQAVINGANLALQQAQGHAGGFSINFVSLDDASPQAGKWDPNQVAQNAGRVAVDRSAIGYIGELDSGASTISIPILNQVPIPMVSPANTAVGLTSSDPATKPGEPAKYYPTGRRNYVRVVANDSVQAAVSAAYMKDRGCSKLYVLNDGDFYGTELAADVAQDAANQGLQVLANDTVDRAAPSYRPLAQKIAALSPKCVMFAGTTETNAVGLFNDLATALPRALLFGSDGLATSSFTDPAKGGIPPQVAARTFLTAPMASVGQYPPAGRKFFADYRTAYADPNPDPYAIYGYEAMGLLLDAINRAGPRGNTRQAVIDQLFATQNRAGVTGTYSIDKNGDTTIRSYGVLRIAAGQPSVVQTITAPQPQPQTTSTATSPR